MCKVNSMFLKMGVLISSLALMLGVMSASVACAAWFHQPKVPEGMEKFKKH